jgi:autotransporter-associated beta strand protein
MQIVLGTAGDVWQGTDDPASGFTGNGLTTLTIDLSKYTGVINIDSSIDTSNGNPPPDTVTFHGTGSNGPLPTVNTDWAGDIITADGTVRFGSSPGTPQPTFLLASGTITVNSAMTDTVNLSLQPGGDLIVNAPITVTPSPALKGQGIYQNGELDINAANITVNAPIQSASITNAADLLATELPGETLLEDINLTATGKVSLNAPISTGQFGTPDQPLDQNAAAMTGSITITAATVVGNAQGVLSTGSSYGIGSTGNQFLASGGVNVIATGDITLPASVAISTGDSFFYPDANGGGGLSSAGRILLNSNGTISADGARGRLNVHFGLAEESDGGVLHRTPVGYFNDTGLLLGALNGQGTGNIYIAATGNTDIDLSDVEPLPNFHQTVDITTSGGDAELRAGYSPYGVDHLAGDDISIREATGTLTVDASPWQSNTNESVNFGNRNVSLTADEINVANGFLGEDRDNAATNSIFGTGALLLQPATPGRNIVIGGDNSIASALNLSRNDLAALAPGFASITIGRPADDSTGTVDILDPTTFASPTTIYGGSFTSKGVQMLTTTAGNDLTLHAHSGSIGGFSLSNTLTRHPPIPDQFDNDNAVTMLQDLAAAVPAGGHYSAQVVYTGGYGSTGHDAVFMVYVDGSAVLTQAGSGDYYGGSVDLELELPAASSPAPTLHTVTVQLHAPRTGLFTPEMVVVSQTVSIRTPNGGVNHPIGATAGGSLHLIADAGNGAGDIFAVSNQALSLQQNVFATTGAGHNAIGLVTTTGDITVPNTEPNVWSDDLYLLAAGSLNIPTGFYITAPALTLSAGGALNFDSTQTYTATLGDMTLASGTTSIGTASQPVAVRVAGKLNLATASTTLGNADIFITSPAALNLGSLSTGAAGSTVNITTTQGGITLEAANTVNGNVTLNSAGSLALSYAGVFQASTLTINAAGPITGGGELSTSGGDLDMNVNGSIGTATAPLLIGVAPAGELNVVATAAVFITSPQNLTVGSLSTASGETVDVATVGGANLTTKFGSGVTGDQVTLDAGTGLLTMQLPSGTPLDFGNGAVTLIGDTMAINGPAGSIEGTGPLVVEPSTPSQAINLGGMGAGLDLLTALLNVFAATFNGITIGRANGSGVITVAGDTGFAMPTMIVGGSFSDPDQHTLSTTGSADMTLHARTGAIGSGAGSMLVNVAGHLNLTTDAAGGVGNVYVASAGPLTLGQNVALATGPGRDTVVLSTSSGDINVPASISGNDNLTLLAAGDLNIADGVTLTEAALNLSAGGALVTGPTTQLVTTSGDMGLTSSTAAIGSSVDPLSVSVAGKLNLLTKASGGANGDIYITSPGTLAIDTLGTGPDADTVNISTTHAGNISLGAYVNVNDTINITSAGTLAIQPNIVFQASSLSVNAAGNVTGGAGASLAAIAGDLAIITSSGAIGTTTAPLNLSDTGGRASLSSDGTQHVATPAIVDLATDDANGGIINIDAGTFNTTSATTIASTSGVAVNGAGVLDIGPFDTNVASVSVQGGQVINSGGRLIAVGGFILWDGQMSGMSGNGPVTKQGSGTATLSGNNPNTGPLTATAGTLDVSPGASYAGNVSVGDASGQHATMDVSGAGVPAPATVSTLAIQTNATLSEDPAILTTWGLTVAAGATMQLVGNDGTSPGTGYDQTVVNGPVELNGATLDWTFAPGFTPAPSTVFDIIQNNGGSAVTGRFNGLAEGAVFAVNGIELRISYQGGASGHDVTLSMVNAPPTVIGTAPSLSGGTVTAGLTSLQVNFSESVTGAGQASNYQLVRAG